ncbi:MAG: hypothetical protein IJT91_05225 [Clostridia bacterium]|nr:hypothetical protein [Clostridia bacterium]
MSELYRSFEKYVMGAGDRLLLKKLKFSEWNAIFKKKKLYSDVVWTNEQQKAFDDFYMSTYGKRFSNRWHRLYQSMNGHFDIKYFPEILFSTKLEKKLNPRNYAEVLCDKNLIRYVYGGVDGVRAVREYASCKNGVYCDRDGRPAAKETILGMLKNVGSCVIKPTTDTGSGKGVVFFDIQNGKDTGSGKTIEEIINGYGENFAVQERLAEHESFAALHPGSINTIRLITYICDGELYHVPLAMRIGSGNSELDNIHAGGMCVGVGDDGTLRSKAFRLGYGDNNEYFTEHPDTHIVFDGYKLSCIPKMIRSAYALHMHTPQLGLISWDFIIDPDEKVVLIEANLYNQSIWFPQIVNEAPAFGENTGKMLEMIRDYK